MSEAKIVISAQDLTSDVFAKVNEAMKTTGESAMTFADSVKHLGDSFVARVAEGVLLRDAIHKVLDVVKEGITSFPELVEHTIHVGNSLYEMSLKTGASVENLSALRYVASQTGIDFESFGTTLFKMEQALGASGAKADEMQKHLDLLGLNLQTLKNEKPDQAFIDIVSALEAMPNRADQAAVGMAIFGRGFKDMAGLTQESITELLDEAKNLGLVMSTETAAAAHAAEIGFKGFSMQLEAVGMEVAATVLPALIALTNLVSHEFHDGVEKAGHPVIDLTSTVEKIALTMLDWGASAITVAQFVDDAFQGIKAAFFGVAGAMVDLGNAEIHLLDMGASLAAKTPLIGGAFTGVRDAIKDTREWMDGFAKGLHDESDGALDAAAKHGQFFDALKTGVGDMKANFHDAFTKAGEEIEHFAGASKAAGGGASTDLVEWSEDTKEWAANVAKWGHVVDEINSTTFKLAMQHEKEWRDESARLMQLRNDDTVESLMATQHAFDHFGLKTTVDLKTLASQAVKDFALIRDSGLATPREIEQAHASMVAAVEAADTSMTAALVHSAKDAGFQTRGQLQETAARAQTLYDEMKQSGLFTAAEVQAAWEKAEEAKRAAGERTRDFHLGVNQTIFDSASQVLGALGQKHKAAAIAGAIIDTYLSIAKSLASLPWPFNLVSAAAAAVVGWETVDKIRSSDAGGYEKGGVVDNVTFRTMGTDTVPAMLTPGEGILTADTTRRLGGPSAIDQLNRGGDLGDQSGVHARLDALHEQFRGLRSDFARMLDAQPMMLRHALRGAR